MTEYPDGQQWRFPTLNKYCKQDTFRGRLIPPLPDAYPPKHGKRWQTHGMGTTAFLYAKVTFISERPLTLLGRRRYIRATQGFLSCWDGYIATIGGLMRPARFRQEGDVWMIFFIRLFDRFDDGINDFNVHLHEHRHLLRGIIGSNTSFFIQWNTADNKNASVQRKPGFWNCVPVDERQYELNKTCKMRILWIPHLLLHSGDVLPEFSFARVCSSSHHFLWR